MGKRSLSLLGGTLPTSTTYPNKSMRTSDNPTDQIPSSLLSVFHSDVAVSMGMTDRTDGRDGRDGTDTEVPPSTVDTPQRTKTWDEEADEVIRIEMEKFYARAENPPITCSPPPTPSTVHLAKNIAKGRHSLARLKILQRPADVDWDVILRVILIHSKSLALLDTVMKVGGIFLDEEVFFCACLGGEMSMIKYLLDIGCPCDSRGILAGIRTGRRDIVLLLINRVPWPPSHAVKSALQARKKEGITSAMDKEIVDASKLGCIHHYTESYANATKDNTFVSRDNTTLGILLGYDYYLELGNVAALDFMHYIYQLPLHPELYLCTTKTPAPLQTETLEWLRSHACPIDSDTIIRILAEDPGPVFAWICKNKIHYRKSDEIFDGILQSTHHKIHMISYLKNGYPIPTTAGESLLRKGMSTLLKRLVGEGFIAIDPHWCNVACEIGDMSFLCWLELQDVPFPDDAMRYAVRGNHEPCITWLLERMHPVRPCYFKETDDIHTLHLLKFYYKCLPGEDL
jgi:hypothetical protein